MRLDEKCYIFALGMLYTSKHIDIKKRYVFFLYEKSLET